MFYIYEEKSTLIIGKDGRPDHRCSYKTHAAAKAAITRMRKGLAAYQNCTLTADEDPLFLFGIAEAGYFHKHIERQVRRKVLEGFGGAEYWEPINTPRYMSPSSEAYWSM